MAHSAQSETLKAMRDEYMEMLAEGRELRKTDPEAFRKLVRKRRNLWHRIRKHIERYGDCL